MLDIYECNAEINRMLERLASKNEQLAKLKEEKAEILAHIELLRQRADELKSDIQILHPT